MSFDADQVLETFQSATEENQLDPLRDQQVIKLPAEGELWIAGDIHDNRTNFRKITVAADLKCDFPQQVHFLFANHDLAQIHGEGIMKAGLSVCEAFTAGVKRDFADQATAMNVAITEFLLSLPIAARTQSGIFFSHSMPTDEQMDAFDYTIFDRPLGGEDYQRRKGPVYHLIWGRGITPAGAEKFLEKVAAKLIVTGHQPQESGYLVNGEKHLIIASDHSQGVFLPIDLSKEYTMDELVELLTKFVAIDA